MRGSYYDDSGLSYLFDMNDPDEDQTRELNIQLGYRGEFFPLCLEMKRDLSIILVNLTLNLSI